MTLSVVDNLVSPVQTYPGGTIAVRCADYAVVTRGSISVVSDPDSISGQVVHETQKVAYDTSAGFGPPFPADYEFVDLDAASTTLSIPAADLHANPNIQYAAFMHWKVVGGGSAGHRIGEDFMLASEQDIILDGCNDTINSVLQPSLDKRTQRPTTNPNYVLRWFQYLDRNQDGWNGGGADPTNLLVVAAFGEDSTYEAYLDALILIPYQAQGNILHYLQYPADPTAWDPLVDTVGTGDPRPNDDNDDDSSNNSLGTATQDAQYSVIYAESGSMGTFFSASGSDYQTADDEQSFYNICNDSFWDGTPTYPDDPSSWIAITAGPKLIPAHTVETETFGTNVTPDESPETFVSSSGAYYWQITNNRLGVWTAEVTGGAFVVGAALADALERLSAYATLGSTSFASDSPTHMNSLQSLSDMSNAVVEATATILATPSSELGAWVGFWQNEWPSFNFSTNERTLAGVYLYEDGGSVKAKLSIASHTGGTFLETKADFDGPVTIGSTGSTIRVKIEKRYYVWRAKVWVDGGSEPGSWTLEGFLPNVYSNTNFTPTSLIVSQYPYDDTDRNQWGANCRAITDWYPMVGVTVEPDPVGTGTGAASFGECTVSYNPYGSTLMPMNIELQKWDGFLSYGSAQIDGDRCIIASLQQHTYNDDLNGFNVVLWKEPGGAELSTATASDFFMRAPLAGWGDIKFP